MPTIEPRRVSRRSNGASFAGIDISPEALLANAQNVAKRLGDYSRKPAPERPEALEMTDEALREAARKSERKARVTKAEHDALVLFATWRAAVFRVEEEMRGNLMLLLGCLNRLEAIEGTEAAVRQIRDFLKVSYQAWVPEPAPWACSDWAERWSARYAQQRNVLPLSLRSLTAAVTVKKPKEEETEESSDESW